MIISLFVILISFLYCFISIRSIIFGIVDYLMNKNAIKKRKKGSSFKEWLFFKRFRTEIPKYHILIYYLSFIVYIIILLIVFILHIKMPSINFNKIRVWIVMSTILFCGLYQIILYGFHTGYTFIHKKDKIKIRGIDKKIYKEKMKNIEKNKNSFGSSDDN